MIEDGGDTCRARFDGLGLKTIGGGFTGLGLKTRAEVPRTEVSEGRHVTASGRLRGCKATDEEARWPSDQGVTPSQRK